MKKIASYNLAKNISVLYCLSVFIQPVLAYDYESELKTASELLSSGQWNKSKQIYNDIINYKIKQHRYDLELAQAYTKLSDLEKIRGNFPKSIYYLQNAIYLKQKISGPASVINQISALSDLFNKIGQSEYSSNLNQKIVSYVIKQLRLSDNINVQTLDCEALNNIPVNLGSNPVLKENSLEWASIVDKIGDYNRSKHNFNDCLKCYNLSLLLRLKATSGKHLALSQSFDKLGQLHLETGNYKLAKTYYFKSYEMSKSILGSNRIETINRGINLAKSYIASKDNKQGSNLLLDQYNICKNAYGLNSVYLANIEYELAQSCDSTKAKDYLSHAINVLEKNFGPSNAKLVPYLDLYGQILAKTNENDKANKLIARSKSIQGL